MNAYRLAAIDHAEQAEALLCEVAGNPGTGAYNGSYAPADCTAAAAANAHATLARTFALLATTDNDNERGTL